MYPNLHQAVMSLLEEDDLFFDFHSKDDDNSCTHSWDTNIMGRFNCYNPHCDSNGWSSRKIAITIRMYHGGRYNTRVYHQRCERCQGLSRPRLDETCYAERVAYRLQVWNGIDVERPAVSHREGLPHQSALCEGCMAGHCRELESMRNGLAQLSI